MNCQEKEAKPKVEHTPTPWEKEHLEKCGPECTGECPLRAQIYDRYHSHTPIPWELNNRTDGYEVVFHMPANGLIPHTKLIFMGTDKVLGPSKKDAEFIVRAVNSHEALLEAAKQAIKWIESRETNGTIPDNNAYWNLRNAIAQAEGIS